MMTFINKNIKQATFSLIVFIGFVGFSQAPTSTIKAQVALGANNPSNNGFVEGFRGKQVNMPTVNLGVQYMPSRWGGKLDYGFNRISSDKAFTAFKLNYSRINLQLVYDASSTSLYAGGLGVFFHAGPGFSMVNPLGDFTENKVNFLNLMGGIEVHRPLTKEVALFIDASYIYGFGKGFTPVSNGFGSFKGNLLTLTVGISISLSGCYYCKDHD